MELHVCQSFFLSLFNFLRNSSLRSFYFLYVSLSGKQRHLFIILWRFKNLDWRSHRVKYLPRFGFWSSCKLSSVLLLRCGEIVVRLAPFCLALALEWSCWHVMAQKHLFEIRVSSIVTGGSMNGFQCVCLLKRAFCGRLVCFPSSRRVRKMAKSDFSRRRVSPSVRMEQLGFHWTDSH